MRAICEEDTRAESLGTVLLNNALPIAWQAGAEFSCLVKVNSILSSQLLLCFERGLQ